MNKWHVYEFCKNNRNSILGLSKIDQLSYVKSGMPGVHARTVISGLNEFRSVPPHNWY